MRNPERLAAVQQVLREKHDKLFALKTASLASLGDQLVAEGQAVDLTHAAWLAARRAVDETRQTFEIISEAQDALASIYEADRDLEDIVKTDTP